MIAERDFIPAEDIIKASVSSKLLIPFFQSYVQAGFPSPADNYLERVCDLNDLCVTNAEATYFVRVTSDSMFDDRIEAGDVLVVDASRDPVEGKIVVASLNGDHTVKRIHYSRDGVVLLPANNKYKPISVKAGDDFRVLGVVTYVIHKPM
ncbi:translesion error-prone DNA polymerase V autoproteolytic subunit [Nibrella saemangeumensis]|uniref:Translesion error-prone DNA polymerase V autoproteolytic subunit n=1 Tax=Nibrella saemangeumensis TaxID=1084526 RepID=A0ABP8NAU4_9BACT